MHHTHITASDHYTITIPHFFSRGVRTSFSNIGMESNRKAWAVITNRQPPKVLRVGPGIRKYREHEVDKSGMGLLERWKRWNQLPTAPVFVGCSQSINSTDPPEQPAYSGISMKLSRLPWTPADDQMLLKLRKLGISYQTIKEVYFPQRTVRACSSRFLSPTFRTQFPGTDWDKWSRKAGSVVR